MQKYQYTVHAEEKLAKQASRKLDITKERMQKVVENPILIDKSEKPVLIAIGNLTSTLSLCVVYRRIKTIIRIITFYPAEKGRYESKILSV